MMSASPARVIAFEVLRRVDAQDAYASEVLRARLDRKVRREDAALATNLTLGVLRWQRLLDVVIDRHLTGPSNKLDAEVRIALRLGVYQLVFLDRVPARAAVHESAELVKLARKRSAVGLVNAVLRKISAAPHSMDALVPKDAPREDQLGVRYSHPTWMVARWLHEFGKERTTSLLESNNREAHTSFHALDDANRSEAFASLERTGCRISPGNLLREAFSLQGGNPAGSEAVRRGWIAIQDEASQAVAHLLDVRRGDFVLDLCAAPGGKTLMLARAAGDSGRVIAADLHEHRLRALAKRIRHAGCKNVEVAALDGTQPLPFSRPFDRILVDVPCSGTGTLARHPEIRWRLHEEDLRNLHQRQAMLLKNSLAHLAPGGRLVYSTCSLEREENEDVIREVLGPEVRAFRVVSAERSLAPIVREGIATESLAGADGFFRTFPPEHGTDGFFAALIERAP